MNATRLGRLTRLLMRLHVETLFACDDEGRLTTVNAAGGGPAPRLFLGLTTHGLECRFRADLDAAFDSKTPLAGR